MGAPSSPMMLRELKMPSGRSTKELRGRRSARQVLWNSVLVDRHEWIEDAEVGDRENGRCRRRGGYGVDDDRRGRWEAWSNGRRSRWVRKLSNTQVNTSHFREREREWRERERKREAHNIAKYPG